MVASGNNQHRDNPGTATGTRQTPQTDTQSHAGFAVAALGIAFLTPVVAITWLIEPFHLAFPLLMALIFAAGVLMIIHGTGHSQP